MERERERERAGEVEEMSDHSARLAPEERRKRRREDGKKEK